MSRRVPRAGAALLTGGLAAVTARAAYAALSRHPPGGRQTWTRTNHRGEPVTLLEGPASAAAAAAVSLIVPGMSARGRAALAVAGAGAALFGGYDDLRGSGARRGFRGHVGALARGEVTTGAVKLVGIGATGLAAAALLGGIGADVGSATDLIVDAGLAAGGANLVNLFDLRPGRAIKVTMAAGTMLGAASPAGGLAAAAPVGAALAVLPEDVGERAMLGDAGANALGAMLGAAAAATLPRKARVTVLAAIAGLTAASEVVSFTRVIERTPPLRWLDMLGRPARGSAGVGGRSPEVTGPAAPATEQDPEPSRPLQATRSIGRAAVLIGALTAVARVIGLGRQLVFAHTVGNSCLGSAYTTANQVPNIIYDIVLGGALASIMVPVLAGPADRSGTDPEAARATSQISSALLTWTVVLLAPASAILALAAHPVISLLVPRLQGCSRFEAISVGSRMLEVFAPQILLYGLAVVLYGILQAHRRFTAPALAPVLSSLVVIAAYVTFVPLGGAHTAHLVGLPLAAELTLSVGTTAGVAALVLTAAVPAARLRLRPALRFPSGVARRAGSLAVVGIAALIAQDASAVVVTRLANGHGGNGAVVLYSYAWQMFLVPYAVLAIPIAVSAFPVLSARASASSAGPGGGDPPATPRRGASSASNAGFDATSAASTRGVLLVSSLGAALLAGAAVPAARLFATYPGQATHLALALAAFAPGLVGYGLVACLSRVLLADGRNRAAAAAIAGGWLIVIGADVIAVELVTARSVVPVLGLGNTVGMAASGIALLAAVRLARGGGALRGTARAAVAGLVGAAAGAAAGAAMSAAVPVTGFFLNACVALLACCCAVIAFGVSAYAVDGGDLRAVVARARRRALP